MPWLMSLALRGKVKKTLRFNISCVTDSLHITYYDLIKSSKYLQSGCGLLEGLLKNGLLKVLLLEEGCSLLKTKII